jgi:hypothetical protein
MRFRKSRFDGERCLVVRAGTCEVSILVKQIAKTDARRGVPRMPAHGLLIGGARCRAMAARMRQHTELLERRKIRRIAVQHFDVRLFRPCIFCPRRESSRTPEQQHDPILRTGAHISASSAPLR